MSQATKLLADSRTVTFEFGGPAIALDASQLVRTAVASTLVTVVNSAFPQGVGRDDGKLWAAWQEVLTDKDVEKAEMPARQVKWLRDLFARDELKVPVQFAQAREAVLDYLDALLKEPEADNGE